MYDSLVSEIVAIDEEFYSRKSYHDIILFTSLI